MRIPESRITVHSFREGTNYRILIFQEIDKHKPIFHIPGTNALTIGPNAQDMIRRIFETTSRPKLHAIIPGGISSRTHTQIRRWLGFDGKRGRPKKDE